MEDRKSPPISPLPPGCRFRPSEEELLRHYLGRKNRVGAESEGFSGVIGELEVYGLDPVELPESACFAYGPGGKRRHWYCYAGIRGLKGAKRTAKSGFWRRRGRVKMVLESGGTGCLGTRTAFAFYSGSSAKTAVKTDWVLYEYSLLDHFKVLKCPFFFLSHGYFCSNF